jgi:hypothetical protein
MRPDTFQQNSVPKDTDRNGSRFSIDLDRPKKTPNHSHSIVAGGLLLTS